MHATLDGPAGPFEIGTGTAGAVEGGRRTRINGAPAKSADAVLEWLRVVWLTPAMDRLFQDGASERRRFLDRLVVSGDPAHAVQLARYAHVLRQRAGLLRHKRQEAAEKCGHSRRE